MTPELLILGHIVKDITDSGWQPGGGALYAATQATRLGLRTAVVTRCGNDVEPAKILPGVDWHVVSDSVSTSFENVYSDGGRSQRLQSLAGSIVAADLPDEWPSAPLILVASVFQDIDVALVRQLAQGDSLVGVGVQGFLRRREGTRVLPVAFEPQPEWLAGDVVFVSEEDVDGDPEAVQAWLDSVSIVVLTRGERGCTVWQRGARHDLPAIASNSVDPTGAGDVFAAAFLIEYGRNRDVLSSARFASAAAALAVRGLGIESVGGRDEIEALLQTSAVSRT